MPYFPMPFKIKLISFSLVSLLLQGHLHAAMDPGFELDQNSLKGLVGQARPSAKTVKKKGRSTVEVSRKTKVFAGSVYTVRSGDNLFKILMREYALTNDEAEALVEEIRRENNIYDIKRLKVGQKISIPHVRRNPDGTLIAAGGVIADTPNGNTGATVIGTAVHGLKLEAPSDSFVEQNAIEQVKGVWEQLVPSERQAVKPLSFDSNAFSLKLDPQRFPVFAAQNGGRIVVDSGAALPPLVKSLITSKDPAVRIVTEQISDRKRFLAAMLDSAGFYSVEPNFRLEFGMDPKLLVNADFKIEKNADSIIKQDVVLMNSGSRAIPSSLGVFLKQEGFSMIEPFAQQKTPMKRSPLLKLLQVRSSGQPGIVDAYLESLAIPFQSQRHIDVFSADKNGFSLSVKVERYFETSGKKVAVAVFDGDPVTYTLFRILETSGYRVVMLEKNDDFRRIAEKMMPVLPVAGEYSTRSMWPEAGSRYSVRISGVSFESPSIPGGFLFMTDRPLDPVIRELLKENGYEIKTM